MFNDDVEDDVAGARALGWASIGIGLTELLAPKKLQQMLGVRGHTTLIRALGVRELLSGVTILSESHPTDQLAAGVWSRVAGDAMDMALLGAAAKVSRRKKGLSTAFAMVAGITALDMLFAERLSERRGRGHTRRSDFLESDAYQNARSNMRSNVNRMGSNLRSGARALADAWPS